MTPRATMSTRVLETIDIITATLSTPGFWSTSLVRFLGVDGHEGAVRELREGVDLGERHVVLHEQPRELREDRREAVQLRPGDAERGDHVLRPEVHVGQDRGEVAAPYVVRVLLGHLLDVDPAHVAEDERGQLADPVVDDA